MKKVILITAAALLAILAFLACLVVVINTRGGVSETSPLAGVPVLGRFLEVQPPEGEEDENAVPVALESGRKIPLLTARAAAEVAGEQVSGKTGSAEWSETEPTHAWFIGYWDGLGIAVVVESGGAGGQVAAPIAAAFIEALAG